MKFSQIYRECASELAVKTAPKGLRATKSAYAQYRSNKRRHMRQAHMRQAHEGLNPLA